MDADRFDTISRLLGARGTRRAGFTTLLGGALGLSALIDADEGRARSGRCRKSCGSCKTCRKGKCVRTARGTRCKPGKCIAVRSGTRCPGGTCLGGRCAPFPTPPPPCRTLRESCADDCCDGLVCDRNGCDPGNVCIRPIGKPCDGDDCNCSNLLQKCSDESDTCRACVFPAEACTVADDCCFPDSSCGPTPGTEEAVCCFTEGNPNCLGDFECCAGLVCSFASGFGVCVAG
jgi:hypothetical protein